MYADLGSDWAKMFSQLPPLGSCMVATRNAAAILQRRTRYPSLTTTVGGDKGAGGGLWLDFRLLGSARALHLRRESGHLFGIEILDESGWCVHTITMTDESDLDAFFDWVRLHQACAAQHKHTWPSANRGDATSAAAAAAGATGPSMTTVNTSHHTITVPLMDILEDCVRHRFPLQVTVPGSAAVHRLEFTTEWIHTDGDWSVLAGEETAFHFHSHLRGGTTMQEDLQREGQSKLILHAITDSARTVAHISVADPALEPAWNACIARLAQSSACETSYGQR